MLNIKTLRKAQLIMLDELVELDRICKKNDIDYWLTDGTLLGAIRHKGFIPWDDDVDVCLLEKDYQKLLKIIKGEINDKYFVQSQKDDKEYPTQWIKIRDRNSIMICAENEKFHQGISIDIFPMINFSNINKSLYKFVSRVKDFEYEKNTRNKSLKIILKNIVTIFRINKLCNKILSFFKDKNDKQNIGYKYVFPQLYKYKDIFPLSEIEFEGYKFPCPNNPDTILRELYGDTYMELPPEKDRVWHAKEIRLNEKCFFEKELERTGRKLYEDD